MTPTDRVAGTGTPDSRFCRTRALNRGSRGDTNGGDCQSSQAISDWDAVFSECGVFFLRFPSPGARCLTAGCGRAIDRATSAKFAD
jgi:hypothetical protein